MLRLFFPLQTGRVGTELGGAVSRRLSVCQSEWEARSVCQALPRASWACGGPGSRSAPPAGAAGLFSSSCQGAGDAGTASDAGEHVGALSPCVCVRSSAAPSM